VLSFFLSVNSRRREPDLETQMLVGQKNSEARGDSNYNFLVQAGRPRKLQSKSNCGSVQLEEDALPKSVKTYKRVDMDAFLRSIIYYNNHSEQQHNQQHQQKRDFSKA
jgi:hypothetical protein